MQLPNVELAGHYSPLFSKKEKRPTVLRLQEASFEFDRTAIGRPNENLVEFQLKAITFDVKKVYMVHRLQLKFYSRNIYIMCANL